MVRDILRLELAVFAVSKYLNRMRRSLVWPRTVSTLGFHCSRVLLYDFCVFWVIHSELLGWLISPCELILVLLL